MAVSVNNLVTITNTGLAARLRAIRVRAGKSQAEIAQRLGLNEAWYADLEQRDGELTASLTLFKAMELASLFGVTLHELIGAPIIAGEAVAVMDLPDKVRAHALRNGISIEQLEYTVGFDLQDFLASPVQLAAELPLLFFQKVAEALGMNWLALIPGEHTD